MKLVSVTVENFRSITAARKIPLSQLTTLVGPNNEGKSNILRAIVFAMRHLLTHRGIIVSRALYSMQMRASLRSRGRMREMQYNWENDCPIKLQMKPGDQGSKITLEFELSVSDIVEFQREIGSKLNGTLPVAIQFLKDTVNISIVKPGRGGKSLGTKTSRIANFLAKKIDIQYIPAVRTAESAMKIVEELVARELSKVEIDPKYEQAMLDISNLQQPVLDDLSRSITETMRSFLPNIKQAKIVIPEQDRSFALRGLSSITLDDGEDTILQAKGDGVQSLAALALMRHSSLSTSEGKEILLALEEPESHLHPGAIRQLRAVLAELSTRSQVVLTTHNPVFTNRENISQNIIVEKNRAYAAKTVKEVRDILGVRLDDNLTSAELVLIVEGDEDKMALEPILRSNDALKSALLTGRLFVDVLRGASNLVHRVRLHQDNVCKVHVFLDDDVAGRNAFDAARKENLLEPNSVNLTIVGGKTEAEFEDLYDESVFIDILKSESGLTWVSFGPDKQKKWSERVRNLLRRAGKPHAELDLRIIKFKVARAAAELGIASIHPSKTGPLDSLLASLEAKLKSPIFGVTT